MLRFNMLKHCTRETLFNSRVPLLCVKKGATVLRHGAGGTAIAMPRESVSQHSRAPEMRARILVAEDNPINLDIGTRILQGLGCAVVAVDNGSAAVALLVREQFDA